jgi:hypothetical protein
MEQGAAMDRLEATALWAPPVLGKKRLDKSRWIYAVAAPFDMAFNIPELMGRSVHLDEGTFQIRGIVPKMPSGAIRSGEVIALLVVRHDFAMSGWSDGTGLFNHGPIGGHYRAQAGDEGRDLPMPPERGVDHALTTRATPVAPDHIRGGGSLVQEQETAV